jgi:hypothetical protein
LFTLALDGDFLATKYIQFTFGIGLLIHFPLLGTGGDGVKYPSIRDSRFCIVTYELIAVGGYPDSGVFGFGRDHNKLRRGNYLLSLGLIPYYNNIAHNAK